MGIFSLCLAVSLVGISQAYLGNYHCEGDRDVIVHLFEWKWSDVANECETFLADAGYCAVQVSPANEHAVINFGGDVYPWWQRYQPVSYEMNSRSGNEAAFRDMVTRCNNVGVRIYVDLVINHMTGGGSGTGSGGSSWDGGNTEGGQSYPGVPYGPNDFHGRDICPTSDLEIHDYNDAHQVRYCWLVGLRDLRMGSDWVRDKLTDFFNKLIDWGVAGFRIDASKHMLPDDCEVIFNRLNNLNTQWFPANTRPFVFQEVISMSWSSEPIRGEHYTHLGRVTEFNQGWHLANCFQKIDGQKISYLQNFGESWDMLAGLSAVVFIDNHDNQRGHGAGGDNILFYQRPRPYKMATAFELAWDYGYPRLMSSYEFDRANDGQGPPSDGSGNTNDVSCFNDWVCEHRWRQIANMVKFHNAAVGSSVNNWWDNGEHAIAFGRGSNAFIVLNNEEYQISQSFSTDLPDGDYCDVISCEYNRPQGSDCGETSDGCRGIFTVSGGSVFITVPNDENPMVALHV